MTRLPTRADPASYRVAVPSYRRVDTLATRTLPMLLTGGVAPDRIAVYAHASDDNLPDYRGLCDSAGITLRVSDVRGIAAQRETILADHPPGTALLQVDDDVSGVFEAIDTKYLRRVDDVDGFARRMFAETTRRDLWVWGLAPVPNAFFLTPGRLFEGLKFAIFSFLGCYTRPGHPVHTTTVETKEDYELCLRAWWWDGGILRHDGAAARADHYSAGGCSQLRTPAIESASAEALSAAWPGLVRPNTRRQGPYAEVLLARRGRGPSRAPSETPPVPA